MRHLSQQGLDNVVSERSSLTGFIVKCLNTLNTDYIPFIHQLEKLAETLELDISTVFVKSKISFYLCFRGMIVTTIEQEGIDFFNMMLAARQQGKALFNVEFN